ncbi:MAG: hypothetical protein KF891_00950 [Rhizobacter sp.]|nr:hypothetical protein [Rhizobacter sp.]
MATRMGAWLAVAAATCLALGCDPKTPKPAEPPKPIAHSMKTPDLPPH